MVRGKLLLLFTWFVICKCENICGIDWSLYQKLQTLQIGLIQNENLNKYVNLSQYSINDNKVFIEDRTKVIRSYNTEKCIKDLEKVRAASKDLKINWVTESKQYLFI